MRGSRERSFPTWDRSAPRRHSEVCRAISCEGKRGNGRADSRSLPASRRFASADRPLPRLAAPISFQVLLSLGTDRAGAPPSPARGSLDMLPKVETEALGLVRSNGERGHMPENMQGKGRENRRAPGQTDGWAARELGCAYKSKGGGGQAKASPAQPPLSPACRVRAR